ncbi:MAG: hypothetical protein GY801_33275 [bacterium]|nr:hypothetical protein [bacterium]
MLHKIELCDTRRKALQIALPDSTKGLNDSGRDVDMNTIEQAVRNVRTTVMKSNTSDEDTAYQKMLAQVDRYWDKLFAAPISVETPPGTYILHPQRTPMKLTNIAVNFLLMVAADFPLLRR